MLALAFTLQALLLVYHQVTTRFDFFPFNGPKFYSGPQREIEAGFNLILMLFPLIGFAFRLPRLMQGGVCCYFIIFAVECATWWAPYFLGASPKWSDIYTRLHGQTTMVLPRRGNNPQPNLEHLILMALTLLTAWATLAAYNTIRSVPFHGWRGVLGASAILCSGVIYQFCFAGKEKSDRNVTP